MKQLPCIKPYVLTITKKWSMNSVIKIYIASETIHICEVI